MGAKSFFCVALVLGMFGGMKAWAIDDGSGSTLQSILTMTTDAEPGLSCNIQLSLDASSAINGLQVDCTGTADAKQQFVTLDQLEQGVVLSHNSGHNIDVLTLSIMNVDPVHGGTLKLHFLEDFFGKKFQDFTASLENNAGNFELFTSTDNTQFNQLFAAKHTFLGQVVGIKSISTSFQVASSVGQ